MPPTPLTFPQWSRGEEIANAVSHGVGVLLGLVGLPLLVVTAATAGDPWQVVGSTIFGVTLILMYTASTLYHAFPPSRLKHVFRQLDHAAIYLLIAGTYTPFTLGSLRGAWGWSLFGVVWGLAYALVEQLTPDAFRFPETVSASAIQQQLLYFSLVTLTTAGYGDISPQSPFAQALANLEAILGQIYLAVLVARLVGIQVAQGMSAARWEQ